MTQSDKWKKRPSVLRYFLYADELRVWAEKTGYALTERLEVTFVLPMAASWSEKKKLEHDGMPHKSKPDIDNLCKAFMDALAKNDSFVHDIHAKKIWGYEGKILIEMHH